MEKLLEWAAKVGLPAAIGVFLVYQMTGDFSSRLKAIEAQHAVMSDRGNRIEALNGRALASNEKVLLVLRQICVQNAKTATDRRDCLKDKE